MMESQLPQYYVNDLASVSITRDALLRALRELRTAIFQSTKLLEESYSPPDLTGGKSAGKISDGDLGIALAYLRLSKQVNVISEDGTSTIDYKAAALKRMALYPMDLDLQPGRHSPLTSPAVGALLLRLLAGSPDASDPEILLSVVKRAIASERTFNFRDHDMGTDEVLAGRAGLLSMILDVYNQSSKGSSGIDLTPVYDAVPELLEMIIEAGEAGAMDYRRTGGKHDIPLMWTWIDGYHSLGAMHGITGILAVLLHPALGRLLKSASKVKADVDIEHLYALVARATTAICDICVSDKGSLVMSVPPWPSSRTSPLVQLCHGAPGLLLLLGVARINKDFGDLHWATSWNTARRLAVQKVWAEGLLSKGAGICHGIAGNAMALLILHQEYQFSDFNDEILGRSVAMLLLARETPPYIQQSNPHRKYRMPDSPFSLFEGLAGTMCAWADGCAVIEARLRTLELVSLGRTEEEIRGDEVIRRCLQSRLGIPGFGDVGQVLE